MGEIIGLGGLVYDFICQVDKMPCLGETRQAKELKINLGGKSANSVVQASLLGNVTTAVIGKVGADQYGREQLADLRSYGVNADHVKMSLEEPTSTAFVTIDATGCNQIVLASGADKSLSVSDIAECSDAISRCRVLIANFEVPIESTLEALDIAKRHGAVTILVPAPVPDGFTQSMLPEIDVLCPNEIEAGQILGMTIDSVEVAMEAVEKLFETGKVRWPIITMGDKGAVVGVKPGSVKHITAPVVKPVDTTGAGDSFVGSLAYQFVKEPSLSIDIMVMRAVFIASLSTTKKGTRPSYVNSIDLAR